MFIIYEYAACLLVALTVGTLLFAAGAMCVMLIAAGSAASRWWPDLTHGANGLMGRWTAEPRVP
jgi:uncharacterized membrane protein YphA (DoxX/SURF4 family)